MLFCGGVAESCEDRKFLVVRTDRSLRLQRAGCSHVRGRFHTDRSARMVYHRSKRNHPPGKPVRRTVPRGVIWICPCRACCLSRQEKGPPRDRQFTNLPSSISWRQFERIDVRPCSDGTVSHVSVVNKHNSHFNIHPFARNRGCWAGVRTSPCSLSLSLRATQDPSATQAPLLTTGRSPRCRGRTPR